MTFTPDELKAIEHECGWLWRMWRKNAQQKGLTKQLQDEYQTRADLYGSIVRKVKAEIVERDTEGK